MICIPFIERADRKKSDITLDYLMKHIFRKFKRIKEKMNKYGLSFKDEDIYAVVIMNELARNKKQRQQEKQKQI